MSGGQPVVAPRVLIDGQSGDTVSVFNRGLAYGDGLFETVRFVAQQAPLWERHMTRLTEGLRRLAIRPVDNASLLEECRKACANMPRAIVKIIVTRGGEGRGYATPDAIGSRRIIAAFPDTQLPRDWSGGGMRVRLCQTRLSTQPALAGIKHLNRLEQVLARAEWDDTGIHEGLMLDEDANVVCATAANLFAVFDGLLVTPPLDRCGVAGVMRAEIMAREKVAMRTISMNRLQEADEVFLTNAIRGIRPVGQYGQRHWPTGAVTRGLTTLLYDLRMQEGFHE